MLDRIKSQKHVLDEPLDSRLNLVNHLMLRDTWLVTFLNYYNLISQTNIHENKIALTSDTGSSGVVSYLVDSGATDGW